MQDAAHKNDTYSSPGHQEQEKAPNTGVFRFLKDNGVKMGSKKYITYREPRIVKTAQKWYVEYYYRVPRAIRDQHNNKEWQRFRVYEDINRHKTDEYATMLRDAVSQVLSSGFNPFEVDQKITQFNTEEKKIEWSLNVALDKYLERCKENGLRKKTLQSYGTIVNFMKDYFIRDNSLYKPLRSITKDRIKEFMSFVKAKQNWNNNTYNNNLGYLIAVFNWFIKEEKIDKNPAKGLELKSVSVTKHKYYDDKTAELLKKKMALLNPYLLKFIEFIYYTATRPKSEARLLKCKHVLFERKLLFVPAEISKNKKDDYIPMSDELIEMLKSMGVDKAPKEYYIFSRYGKPADKPASQNHFASLYKPFKDAAGLGEDFSIYSWKHVRAIHLALDSVDPYEIMKFLRHSDLSTTMIYLRELGIADRSAVIKNTRRF